MGAYWKKPNVSNVSNTSSVLIQALLGLAFLFVFLAILAVSNIANAQLAQSEVPDDSGDFSESESGSGGEADVAPPNEDSERVPDLGLQTPTYAGTGCPQGTVSAMLSPDQRSLSILFDQYIARAGGSAGQARNRLTCQISIPFRVPPGYRAQVVKMHYRGFVLVPHGAQASIGAGFRYLEINGTPVRAPRVMREKVFQGPKEKNFRIASVLPAVHWSPCGKSFVLAAESYVNAQTNRRREEVITTVDSLDAVQMPVQYSLRWKRCNGNGDGNSNGDGNDGDKSKDRGGRDSGSGRGRRRW